MPALRRWRWRHAHHSLTCGCLRFLLRLPPVPWCVNKELMRRTMQADLPGAVRERPKTAMLEDPLKVCLESGRWAPALPAPPPSAIHSYVDWKNGPQLQKTARCFNNGSHLFSLAFALWLKDIENTRGIE